MSQPPLIFPPGSRGIVSTPAPSLGVGGSSSPFSSLPARTSLTSSTTMTQVEEFVPSRKFPMVQRVSHAIPILDPSSHPPPEIKEKQDELSREQPKIHEDEDNEDHEDHEEEEEEEEDSDALQRMLEEKLRVSLRRTQSEPAYPPTPSPSSSVIPSFQMTPSSHPNEPPLFENPIPVPENEHIYGPILPSDHVSVKDSNNARGLPALDLHSFVYLDTAPSENNSDGTRDAMSSFSTRREIRRRLENGLRIQHLSYASGQEPHGIPQNVNQSYHSIYELRSKPSPLKLPTSSPMLSTSYKALDERNGSACFLRRIIGVSSVTENSISAGEIWKEFRHPNVVALRDVFISRDFQSSDVVFVYEFLPMFHSLERVFFGENFPHQQKISEKSLWSIAVQMLSALQAAHSSRLCFKILSLSSIGFVGKSRVKIDLNGVSDVLGIFSDRPFEFLAAKDIHDLGCVLLSLASLSIVSNDASAQDAFHSAFSSYSPEFFRFLNSLYTASEPLSNYVAAAAPFVLSEMSNAYSYIDDLESDLMKEMQNGRVLRSFIKMGFVLEKPRFRSDDSWSETGDAYLVKLFRDYVFHQESERGNPIIDFGSVVDSLSRLDLGSEDRIPLLSRDGDTMLVMTYRDVRKSLDGSFRQLWNAYKSELDETL